MSVETLMPQVIPLPSGFGLAIDTTTGETFQMLDGKSVKDDWQRLTEKYLGRSAARRLLSKFRVYKGGVEVPAYRVVRCGRAVLNQKEGVSVFRALAAPRAHFAGIVQCGSVWHCPVCSAKVAARRSAEMVIASDRCRAEGGAVGLVTLTVKHSATDTAAESLERLQRLSDRMNGGKRAKAWRESWGVLGQIRAIEFTVRDNGWHPHVHSLVFLSAEPDSWAAVGEGLRARYIAAAKAEFGWLLPEVAVDVRGGSAAANYISGWSIESEVSGGAWKQGKNGSAAPFDLLLQFSSPDGTRSERAEAGRRFLDFATAVSKITEGRVSTVRQLVWSRGLKQSFGVDEKTDEEIAAAMEEPALLLGNLGFDDWLRVLNHKVFDARLVVLQLASLGDWCEVRRFIDSLPQLQPQSSKE